MSVFNGATQLANVGNILAPSHDMSATIVWASPAPIAAGSYTYTIKWIGQDSTVSVAAGFASAEILQK